MTGGEGTEPSGAAVLRVGHPDRVRPGDPRFRSGPPRHQPVLLSPPDVVVDALGGKGNARWTLVWVKEGTEVWRVDGVGGGRRFVKVGAPGAGAAEVVDEAARLRWIASQRPIAGIAVPEVVAEAVDQVGAWMVTVGVGGAAANEAAHRSRPSGRVAEELGVLLDAFHQGLDPSACPFRSQVADLLKSVMDRASRGGLRSEDLPLPFTDGPPETAVAWLVDHAPVDPPAGSADRVVAHGDAGVPNLLLVVPCRRGSGARSGTGAVVDLGRMGVADRHLDLALVLRSFVANFGADEAWRIFDAIGGPAPDADRIEWYRIVDDLW